MGRDLRRGLRVAAIVLFGAALPAAAASLDKPTQAWVQTLLARWQIACRDYLHQPLEPLAWSIFYDDRYALHLNPDLAVLPPRQRLRGKQQYAGKKYKLYRVEHREGRVWAPGREPLPVAIGGAAMPYQESKVFFELALPAIWQRDAGVGPSHDLDEAVLGAALHEMTHTRQLGDIARRLDNLRQDVRLPASIDDNIIENTFKQNEAYQQQIRLGWDQLLQGLRSDDPAVLSQHVAEYLAISAARRARFHVGDYEGWSEVEDLFLVMEGTAMWVQYRMALDQAPAGSHWLVAAGPLFEHGDAWSQVEGLMLFLAIDRLAPNWQATFFSPHVPSPSVFLQKTLDASR